jgi:acyl-coenzyme A thioesterase PaaI-like protein
MTLHFLAPGRVGPVRAVGELLRSGSGGATVEVRVYDRGKSDRLMTVALVGFTDLAGASRMPSDNVCG